MIRHIRATLAVTSLLLLMNVRAQAPMNFYVPDTVPDEEESTATSKQIKAEESKPPETEKKSEAESPEKKSETSEPPKKEDETVYITSKVLRVKSTGRADPIPYVRPRREPLPSVIKGKTLSEIDPPLDPYGTARAFRIRWDFSSFLPTEKEELRFRLNAANARTRRLAQAFSALSDEVETRQRNLNSAALAAYLLSRDQESWMPVTGRNLTEAQMLAVRVTMRQDMGAMRQALTDYETLRDALNESAEEAQRLDRIGLDAVNQPVVDPALISESLGDVARRQTDDILTERLVSVEALKASMATEMLRDTTQKRQAIASYAPPPPGIAPVISKIAVGEMPSPDKAELKDQPRGEKLNQPERSDTVVIETAINAPVYAAQDGIVAFTGPFRGYGNTVILEHKKDEFSVYSHLGNIQVIQRQAIKAGSLLGRAGDLPESGRTGVHFQVRQGKIPVNPARWLRTDDVGRVVAGK